MYPYFQVLKLQLISEISFEAEGEPGDRNTCQLLGCAGADVITLPGFTASPHLILYD